MKGSENIPVVTPLPHSVLSGRVENSSAREAARFLMVSNSIILLLCIARMALKNRLELTGFGWWADTVLIAAFPLYYFVSARKKLKNQTSQYLRWDAQTLTFQLKGDANPLELPIATISTVNIRLD